jgi:hypothetical protein
MSPLDEIASAVEAFQNRTAYRAPGLFVRRWDETLMPLPGRHTSAIEELVNVRLDDIVYWIYRAQPVIFAPLDRFLEALRRQFEDDRRALRGRQAPAEEHFIRAVKKHAGTYGIQLPAGREDEFAKWVYESPDRCAGLRFGHEVYRALMENLNDVPEAADFSDFAHVYMLFRMLTPRR